MFNAPDIIMHIPDIAAIYKTNDLQCQCLDDAVDQMDKNISMDQMDEATIVRWEAMLGIRPLDDDKLNDRRFRIKAKAAEKLPYSFRVALRKLDALCPQGYTVSLSENKEEIEVKLSLKSKKMIDDVRMLMEDILPLNMIHKVRIIWNQHLTLSKFTHAQLRDKTHREIREEVLEDGE